MINQVIVDYIKSCLSKGFTSEQIKQSLLAQGWPYSIINESIALATPTTLSNLSKPEVSEKSSKKFSYLLIIGIIIAVVIIGGVLSFFIFSGKESPKTSGTDLQTKGQTTVPEVIDCNTDMDCFIASSQECKLSKVTHKYSIDIFGLNQTNTLFYEIKGLEADKCIFYINATKIDVKFTNEIVQQLLANNITQEQINQQEQNATKQAKISEGRDGTCKFNTADLTAVLNKWKVGNFDSGEVSCNLTLEGNKCITKGGDFGNAQCEGKYFSQEV